MGLVVFAHIFKCALVWEFRHRVYTLKNSIWVCDLGTEKIVYYEDWGLYSPFYFLSVYWVSAKIIDLHSEGALKIDSHTKCALKNQN